jgi:hypothetical protein
LTAIMVLLQAYANQKLASMQQKKAAAAKKQ